MQPEGGGGAVAGSMLAGVLMILSGSYSFLFGLAMIIKGSFFTYHAGYYYHWSTTGWGWLEMILGVVVFAAGVCVLFDMVWARVVGIVLATLNAIAAFLTVPFYPFWAIVSVGVSVFVIWALASRRRYALT